MPRSEAAGGPDPRAQRAEATRRVAIQILVSSVCVASCRVRQRRGGWTRSWRRSIASGAAWIFRRSASRR
eukprot:11222060-Lingulodinium_polyedra.AAC.1